MNNEIFGAVLAGGQSRRMNGIDKRLLRLGDSTLLEHAIARAAPQVGQLVVCTHDDVPLPASVSPPIVFDSQAPNIGPAAGIISAFTWAQHQRLGFHWLATFACDTPLFPLNMCAQLLQTAKVENAEVVIPSSNGQAHYAFALWSVNALQHLVQQVEAGQRAIKHIVAPLATRTLDFPDSANAFFNVNTREQWQQLLTRHT